MDIHPIAKLISEKGIDSFDSTMFSPEMTKEVLAEVANIYFRTGKFGKGIRTLEVAGLPLPEKELKDYADRLMLLDRHEEAYHILSKIGDTQMAEFVRANFF